MNIFKKIKEAEEAKPVSKQSFTRSVAATAALLVVFSATTTAWITKAWFSNNKQVDSNGTSITSDVSSPSLFIRATSDANGAGTSVSVTSGANLFPISTSNLTDWYYVSGFGYSPVTENGITTNVPKANAFTAATVTVADNAGGYTNAYENDAAKTAYFISDLTLFTTNGTLDVYLNHDNPITVTYTASQGKDLDDAIRVGLKIGNTTIIYAPAAESGTGNSMGSTAANTFYAVTAADTVSTQTVLTPTTIVSHTATAVQGQEGVFTPDTNATALGTADTTGIRAQVYVWLEGTDAQTIVGTADNETNGLNVTLNFVGVVPSNNNG